MLFFVPLCPPEPLFNLVHTNGVVCDAVVSVIIKMSDTVFFFWERAANSFNTGNGGVSIVIKGKGSKIFVDFREEGTRALSEFEIVRDVRELTVYVIIFLVNSVDQPNSVPKLSVLKNRLFGDLADRDASRCEGVFVVFEIVKGRITSHGVRPSFVKLSNELIVSEGSSSELDVRAVQWVTEANRDRDVVGDVRPSF